MINEINLFSIVLQAIESVNSSVKHKVEFYTSNHQVYFNAIYNYGHHSDCCVFFLQVVDLFVLLILHSTANRKKAMESLIRNKIKNGHFTEEMLSAAFNSHSQVGMSEIK